MSEGTERVLFLGSASGQTGTLETVSFILEAGNRVLVETGPSVIRLLERAGRRPKDLDAIFVTHAHADHSLGFPYLAFAKHIDRIENSDPEDTLNIYCSGAVWSGLRASVGFHYPPGEFQTYKYQVSDIEHTQKGTFGGIQYESLPVHHTVPTFALKFRTPKGRTIVYSSDTSYNEPLVRMAQGSDLLIHEAMLPSSAEELSLKVLHSTVADAARAAREAQPANLAICHMIPSLFEHEQEVLAEIREQYSGNVIFPREGTEVLLEPQG